MKKTKRLDDQKQIPLGLRNAIYKGLDPWDVLKFEASTRDPEDTVHTEEMFHHFMEHGVHVLTCGSQSTQHAVYTWLQKITDERSSAEVYPRCISKTKTKDTERVIQPTCALVHNFCRIMANKIGGKDALIQWCILFPTCCILIRSYLLENANMTAELVNSEKVVEQPRTLSRNPSPSQCSYQILSFSFPHDQTFLEAWNEVHVLHILLLPGRCIWLKTHHPVLIRNAAVFDETTKELHLSDELSSRSASITNDPRGFQVHPAYLHNDLLRTGRVKQDGDPYVAVAIHIHGAYAWIQQVPTDDFVDWGSIYDMGPDTISFDYATPFCTRPKKSRQYYEHHDIETGCMHTSIGTNVLCPSHSALYIKRCVDVRDDDSPLPVYQAPDTTETKHSSVCDVLPMYQPFGNWWNATYNGPGKGVEHLPSLVKLRQWAPSRPLSRGEGVINELLNNPQK